jgi:hypothetical protein
VVVVDWGRRVRRRWVRMFEGGILELMKKTSNLRFCLRAIGETRWMFWSYDKVLALA